jgi:hypothetical protein
VLAVVGLLPLGAALIDACVLASLFRAPVRRAQHLEVRPMRRLVRKPIMRLGRAVRGLWPDRNPLRRATDRVEAALLVTLLAVFLACAPLLGVAAWNWAHAAAQRAERDQRATSHQVSAVLLQSAPPPVLAASGTSSVAEVRAQWMVPGDAVRTGDVPVPGGTKAGNTVTVWIDRAGQLTSPPLSPAQVTGQAAQAAAGASALLALVLAGALLLARRALNRRRLAAWDDCWSAIGPRWTSSR